MRPYAVYVPLCVKAMISNHILYLKRKTAVDFNAEEQRSRVMQRKSDLWGNGKYKNFSDRVNLHQLGVFYM